MDTPSIHDQFEGIVGFVMELCDKESKLIFTHAGDSPAPECENSTHPAKFAIWEEPGVALDEPMGKPGRDVFGNPTDQFNWCPYCSSHVWTHPSTPIGAKLTCTWCGAWFRRAV